MNDVVHTFSNSKFMEACANPYVSQFSSYLEDAHVQYLESMIVHCARNGTARMIDIALIGDDAARNKVHLDGIAAYKANPENPETAMLLNIGDSSGVWPNAGFLFKTHDEDASTLFFMFFLRTDGSIQLHTVGTIRGKEMRFVGDNVDPMIGSYISSAYAIYRASALEGTEIKFTDFTALGI